MNDEVELSKASDGNRLERTKLVEHSFVGVEAGVPAGVEKKSQRRDLHSVFREVGDEPLDSTKAGEEVGAR